MNLEFKIALIRRFGSQIRAAKPLKIDESRLSRLVNGHRDPTADERKRLTVALGADYFAPDAEEARASKKKAPGRRPSTPEGKRIR